MLPSIRFVRYVAFRVSTRHGLTPTVTVTVWLNALSSLHLIDVSGLLTVNTGWLGCTFFPGLKFRYVLLPLGIAPHCLDPGTVCSVTVEKFCGEKWEESMQAHKTIRGMSSPVEETLWLKAITTQNKPLKTINLLSVKTNALFIHQV